MIGSQKHRVLLSARVRPILTDQWRWEVWSPQGGGAEGYTPDGSLPSAKSAATEAGYALLKRLESEQTPMELEEVTT